MRVGWKRSRRYHVAIFVDNSHFRIGTANVDAQKQGRVCMGSNRVRHGKRAAFLAQSIESVLFDRGSASAMAVAIANS